MELLSIIEKIATEKWYSIWILLFLNVFIYLSVKTKSIISFHDWNRKRKIIFYNELIESTDDENIKEDIKEDIRKNIFLKINKFSAEKNYRNEYYSLLKTKKFQNMRSIE